MMICLGNEQGQNSPHCTCQESQNQSSIMQRLNSSPTQQSCQILQSCGHRNSQEVNVAVVVPTGACLMLKSLVSVNWIGMSCSVSFKKKSMREGRKSHSNFNVPLYAPSPSHSGSCLLPVMQIRQSLTIILTLQIAAVPKEQSDLTTINGMPELHHQKAQSGGKLGKEISSSDNTFFTFSGINNFSSSSQPPPLHNISVPSLTFNLVMQLNMSSSWSLIRTDSWGCFTNCLRSQSLQMLEVKRLEEDTRPDVQLIIV